MSKPSDLPLYLALYKLLVYLYVLVANFPKSYKFTLGEDILKLCWETLDGVVLANSLPNDKKPKVIRMASVSFDRLKIRLRLAQEIRLISTKKYAYLMERNEEIGKMLAGWLGWAKKS